MGVVLKDKLNLMQRKCSLKALMMVPIGVNCWLVVTDLGNLFILRLGEAK